SKSGNPKPARDADDAVYLHTRGDAIASKLAPTGACTAQNQVTQNLLAMQTTRRVCTHAVMQSL
ncbi:hypothetical protein, partial [Pseudomonas sp. FSL R10-0399]|uniref:hypothetical protein n=1 Tax=Pseudomonas sp. FSL R10-0399 TaxID=2662194 RepID=UPI001C49A627